MKKILIFLASFLCLMTLVIMYFAGSFDSFFKVSKVNSYTNKYTDRVYGISFNYPSEFTFKKNTFEMGYTSNNSNGTYLMLAFFGGDYLDMCTFQERFIQKPLNIEGQTYSKEIIDGKTVYKYIDLNDGYFANYSIIYGNKCLSIKERAISHDFSILDSILESVKFN